MAEQASLDFERNHDHLKQAGEQALSSAERLAWLQDPVAHGAFDEAESLAIKCADEGLQMRTFEASARFHERRGAIPVAREKYNTALRNAECLSVISDAGVESVARLRWDLARIEYRGDEAFKNLLRASKADDSRDRLRKAWDQFIADRGTTRGRLAARGFGSAEDFRRRIDAAKLDPRDDE